MAPEIWYLTFERPEETAGGLGTYMRQVVTAARTQAREIRVFQRCRGLNEAHRSEDNGIHFIDVPDSYAPYRSGLGYWMNLSWRFAEAVISEIREARPPAAIEIPDGYGVGYFLLQRKWTGDPLLQDVPIMLLAHTPIQVIEEWNGNVTHALPEWWLYRAERWCYKAADCVILLSSMLERELAARGHISHDTRTFRSVNPYSAPASVKKRNSAGAPADQVIGMASRMANWKGLPELLKLAIATSKAGLPIRYELCGQGSPDLERAKVIFKSLFNAQIVRHLGTLDADRLTRRRQGWLCQIHPSRRDNFPYSVLEALSQGLPCLISANNGLAETLDSELRGLLVCDFGSTAEVMEKIANIDLARQRLEVFSAEAFGARAYFEQRDSVIAQIANGSRKALFPFVDAKHSRAGLKSTDAAAGTPGEPRLTVVVPFFNMGRYIDDCIRSLRASAERPAIVIVNDGSDDEASLRVLDRYRSDSSIQVHDIPNGGVATARNYGVSQARTEYVALLDADDTVEKDYYAKALWVLDAYDNVGFVGCWSNDFSDETGQTIRYWPTFNAEPMPNLLVNNTNCQSLVYRKDLYLKHGRHDPLLKMFLDDWDGMLGLLEGGAYGVMLPGPYFNYRQRPNSVFRTNTGLWDVNYTYILNKRSELVRRFAPECLLFSNANGPNRHYHLLGHPTPLGQYANPSDLRPKRNGASLASRMRRIRRGAKSLATRIIPGLSKR